MANEESEETITAKEMETAKELFARFGLSPRLFMVRGQAYAKVVPSQACNNCGHEDTNTPIQCPGCQGVYAARLG